MFVFASLMRNFDIIALSCFADTTATDSISRIKKKAHASNAYLAHNSKGYTGKSSCDVTTFHKANMAASGKFKLKNERFTFKSVTEISPKNPRIS